MKNITTVLLLLSFFLFSCSKEKDEINQYQETPNMSGLIVNNSFILSSTNDTFQTNRAFLSEKYYVNNDSFPIKRFWIMDGEIEDTLSTCCGYYNYITLPRNMVLISMDSSAAQNGIFKYSRDSINNDFSIEIIKNLVFETTPNGLNKAISRETIAHSSGSGTSFNSIDNASLRIQNMGTVSTKIEYIVNNFFGELIEGSFHGNVEDFIFISCDSDCD